MGIYKISETNRTFIYMLIFTIISSAIAYGLIMKGYDAAFEANAQYIVQN